MGGGVVPCSDACVRGWNCLDLVFVEEGTKAPVRVVSVPVVTVVPSVVPAIRNTLVPGDRYPEVAERNSFCASGYGISSGCETSLIARHEKVRIVTDVG